MAGKISGMLFQGMRPDIVDLIRHSFLRKGIYEVACFMSTNSV